VAERQRSREVFFKPFTGPHQPDFSHGALAASLPGISGGTGMHGSISPKRNQKIDAAILTAYLIIIVTAAIVILIHPKPDLIPLLLWHAGHPL
jgi:hypothetical protein